MQGGDAMGEGVNKKKTFSYEKVFMARNAYFDTGLCFETFGLSIVILLEFR